LLLILLFLTPFAALRGADGDVPEGEPSQPQMADEALALARRMLVPKTSGSSGAADYLPALPLALSDDFEFSKVKQFFTLGGAPIATAEESIPFEHNYVMWGAITEADRRERRGHYYTFFWKTRRPGAKVKVRLEYRQQNYGDFVQAREVACDGARRENLTKFQVTGDDFLGGGRVTSWRCLIVEDGKVVGLTNSFLWN
jgi:hypothetical protein